MIMIKAQLFNCSMAFFGHSATTERAAGAKLQRSQAADDSFLQQRFDKEKQWQFGLQVVKELGYDMEAGRQDISEHPFTTNFNSQDVRITTRIDENDLSNMVWSCIHEAGHALYEQGCR